MNKITTTMTWHGDRIIRRANSALEQGMINACVYAVEKCKRYVAQGQPPGPPGGPPHVKTGTLRKSIWYEVHRTPTKIIGYVGVLEGITTGSAEPYALRLEMGEPKFRRPYLRPTVMRYRRKLFSLIVRGYG